MKKFIKKLLRENLFEDRELGKPLSSTLTTPYITIYRAAPITANEFYDKDYVTLSKKFAIEHAENNHVHHEEPFHVIQALVSTTNVFDASNPSEYFYSGPIKKGREIYVTKGPDEFEGYDELEENLLPESKNRSYDMFHGSETQIKQFIDDFVGGKDANDQEGPGIYFTSSYQNARSYGPYVYSVKLTPNKIVSTKDGQNAPLKEIEWLMKNAPDWKSTAENWNENPMLGLKLAAKDFIQYNDNPHQQFLQVWIDFYRDNPVDYVRNMVKLGYDAIIIDNLNSMLANETNITHIIVLNPSIIEFIKVELDK